MKTANWFRTLAGLFVFFTIGHTAGFLEPPAAGSPGVPVYAAMRDVQFPAMGFVRTYLDFYRGFGLLVSVEFVTLALLAWQVASLSVERPRDALPFAMTLVVGCVGTAVLSFVYFFAAPMVISLVVIACAVVGVAKLARDARQTSLRRAA